MLKISWKKAYKQFLMDRSVNSFRKESKLRKKMIHRMGHESFIKLRKEVKKEFEGVA